MSATFLRNLSLLVICSLSSLSMAQGTGQPDVTEQPPAEASSSWYGETGSPVAITPRMIIQQKAQMRAYQRIARMESMKWYGMSASRPLSNATPFAGVPSPRYEMPGGRPFAWHPYRNTNVVIVR